MENLTGQYEDQTGKEYWVFDSGFGDEVTITFPNGGTAHRDRRQVRTLILNSRRVIWSKERDG